MPIVSTIEVVSKRDPSIFYAFLLALAVHAGVWALAFEGARRGWRFGWFDQPEKRVDEVASLDRDKVSVVPRADDEFEPGRHDGTGKGIDDQEADHLQTALEKTQDQAWQSPFRHGDPSATGAESGMPGDPGFQAAPQAMAKTEFTERPLPRVGESAMRVNVPNRAHPNTIVPESTDEIPTTVAERPEHPDVKSTSEGANASTGTPGAVANATAGSVAPESDRALDQFAEEEGMVIRGGKVVSQKGRQVKMAPTFFNLSARFDILSNTHMVFHVRCDADGKPRLVKLVNSTGSESVDRAYILKMYSSWFEPPKRADGTPLPDAFTFTIDLH